MSYPGGRYQRLQDVVRRQATSFADLTALSYKRLLPGRDSCFCGSPTSFASYNLEFRQLGIALAAS